MGLARPIVAGIALVLVLDHFALLQGAGSNPSDSATRSFDAGTERNRADHPGKGNRLSRRLENDRTNRIVAVEIVGLRDAAIVYRDRDGRILFHNDRLTSTTIAAKNFDLLEVTIRDRDDIAVRPAPVPAPPRAERSKLPVGCDPAFGPLADPTLRGLTGRCLTGTASAQTFAALW